MITIEQHLTRLKELSVRGGKSLIVYLQKYPEIKSIIQEKTNFLDEYYQTNHISKKIRLTQIMWHIFQNNYEIPLDSFTLKIQIFQSFNI
jgi:ribonucleotide reductase alpha subunit